MISEVIKTTCFTVRANEVGCKTLEDLNITALEQTVLEHGMVLLKGFNTSDDNQMIDFSKKIGQLLEWDFGGYLVDTPGIKTFGLHRNDKEKIPVIFPGLSVLVGECKFFNCTHSHEIECSVKKALENGSYPIERYESYLRILESL